MNNQDRTIKLKEYNSETRCNEETRQTLSTYPVARSLTLENFTCLLDDYLNLGGKGFREGKQVGLQMRTTHRTLQRLVICFALGMIAGISEQEYTDPSNEVAIKSAKKLTKMLDDDELPLVLYI